MSAFLDSMIAQAKQEKKTIVLPEGNDERTLKAAEKALADGLANLIILGNVEEITSSGYHLEGAQIIDPKNSEFEDEFTDVFYELRKKKGITPEQARESIKDETFFGVMMVKTGRADGMVSGACHSTADTLRPSLQIIKTAPTAKLVSSFFVMVVPDCEFGYNGTFVFSDCGLNVQPNAEELAYIGLDAANSFKNITGAEPVVAYLCHSSYGSAKNDDQAKVAEAVKIAKKTDPSVLLDGELQLDAAIVPSVGASKAPGSPVAGKANVLVFPDIDAGNIGYKLVQRLAKAEAYGPITQGLAAPVNDLSRGCSADDIYGVIAITAVQAQGK